MDSFFASRGKAAPAGRRMSADAQHALRAYFVNYQIASDPVAGLRAEARGHRYGQ
jgi:hypothetical protein